MPEEANCASSFVSIKTLGMLVAQYCVHSKIVSLLCDWPVGCQIFVLETVSIKCLSKALAFFFAYSDDA